jgi:hypothetical protein
MAQEFQVTCPCCRAVLTVDAEVKAVLHHTPPPRTGPAASLDKAMEASRGAGPAGGALREAAEAEKSKSRSSPGSRPPARRTFLTPVRVPSTD